MMNLLVALASTYFHHFNPPSMLLASCLTALLLLLAIIFHNHFKTKTTKVYLVDFACYKPNDSCLISNESLLERAKNNGHLSHENIKFVTKVLARSGLGPRTYVPEGLLKIPRNQSLSEARKESETVFFGAIDELFEKTGIESKEIGILVVNCSVFCPTPSLCDMVVNRYKLRDNVLSYNLSGMGCSAGVVAVDFAKHLLQAHPNSYALVLSTENGTSSLYLGNNPSMILIYCLFRMGGSACLLSSHSSDLNRSKYQIIHTLRTHMGHDPKSYNCVFQHDDEDHKIGVSLSKDLMNVAGETLKAHITSLGPLVLPMKEKLKFLATFVGKKVFRLKNVELYIPDFKLAFEHFCIHTGGRAVLDKMQKSLELEDRHIEPSRMTLYRFGNTSSSSVWYVLAYSEAKGRIKKGDRIWQMAFGSGFKCNSVVWLALDDIDVSSKKNAWMDDIHEFPIEAT